MHIENAVLALALTAIAGISTVLGALIAGRARRGSSEYFSISLGFSAGVMVYLSFFELLVESRTELGRFFPGADWLVVSCFLAGLGIAAVIDFFTHRFVHEEAKPGKKQMLMRVGKFTAVAIAVHNFPEGMATFMTASGNLALGIPLALAVAIHNIPEGICVALPIIYATGKKSKGYAYAAVAGLAEPVGALLAATVLFSFWHEYMMGVIYAAVAGIMVYVALDELLPSARREGNWQKGLGGLVIGMMSMFLILPLINAWL